jgi:hypothetical protein
MVVALEEVEHFLLRLLTRQPADTLGQGRCGVVRDNTQAQFQRGKAFLANVAAFLQRLIQATTQFDVAEKGGDPTARGTFLVLAAVILAIALAVFGGVLGHLWLDMVDDRLQNESATRIEEVPKSFLEVQSGSGSGGLSKKTRGELGDLLLEAKAGLRRQSKDGLELLKDNRSRGDGQNDRLGHGGGLSREGTRTVWSQGVHPSFS